MLVIRGDTRVADIYLTEFMRLFMHFYFQTIVNGIGRFPKNDDSWLSSYYQTDNFKCKERSYFAGKHPF